MRKTILLLALTFASTVMAQSESAGDVMKTLRKVNDYFMMKYADPTLPTNVNRIRPSSLWTRAVYYEGLMALYEIDKDQRYTDYTDRWATFHPQSRGRFYRGRKVFSFNHGKRSQEPA